MRACAFFLWRVLECVRLLHNASEAPAVRCGVGAGVPRADEARVVSGPLQPLLRSRARSRQRARPQPECVSSSLSLLCIGEPSVLCCIRGLCISFLRLLCTFSVVPCEARCGVSHTCRIPFAYFSLSLSVCSIIHLQQNCSNEYWRLRTCASRPLSSASSVTTARPSSSPVRLTVSSPQRQSQLQLQLESTECTHSPTAERSLEICNATYGAGSPKAAKVLTHALSFSLLSFCLLHCDLH